MKPANRFGHQPRTRTASAQTLMALPGETWAEDQHFKRILRHTLMIFLIFAVALPLLPTPKPERTQLEKVPPRIAKVILQRQTPPTPATPPPPPKQQISKPDPKPKPIKPKTVAKKKAPPPQPRTVKSPPQRPAKNVTQREKAREKAANSGLLALQSELQQIREQRPKATVSGQNRRIANNTTTAPKRSQLGQTVLTASGGIKNAPRSDFAVARLNEQTSQRIASRQPATAVSTRIERKPSSTRPLPTGTQRSEETMRVIIDENKTAIFSLYNRALRKDPSLQGKILVELIIEPSGKVSNIKVLSSELSDKRLEKKLLRRIRMINFGAENVARVKMQYAFNFLPS